MILKIMSYELRFWARNYTVYLYASVLFLLGLSAMLISGDILQEQIPDPNGQHFVNSPLALYAKVFSNLMVLILFLLPIIYGSSLHRDIQSNMYKVLYSYPIEKSHYLIGKFLSASIVAIIVTSALGVGLMFGEHFPGLDPGFVGPFNFKGYLSIYCFYIVPSILAIGGIVFATVARTRSIYAGFVVVILIMVFRMIIRSAFRGIDYVYLAAILDPYANITLMYDTQNWTPEQRNTSNLPFIGTIINNRIFWLASSAIALSLSFFTFELHHYTKRIFRFIRSTTKGDNVSVPRKSASEKIEDITYDFTTWQKIKSVLLLSNIYFISIVTSKAFMAIIGGCIVLMIMLIGQVNPDLTSSLRPFTLVVLKIPMLFYMFMLTLLTFVYVGYLVHRDRTTKMNALIDSSPISSGVLIGSKLVTVVMIQILLLFCVVFVGMAIQMYKGFYHFEIWLYLLQLYGVFLITLVIWAVASLFAHALIPNLYLGIFLLILAQFGISALADFGVKEEVFRFNNAPLLEYSDMNGYGSSLRSFYAHKMYWLLFSIILLICTYLVWIRGHVFTIKERVNEFRRRLNMPIGIALLFLAGLFVLSGSWIYHQTKSGFVKLSNSELRQYKAIKEIELGNVWNQVQPSLNKVYIEFDIYPDEENFHAKGKYGYINDSGQAIDSIWVSGNSKEVNTIDLDQDYILIHEDSVLNYTILKLSTPLIAGDSLLFTFEMSGQPNTTLKSNAQIAGNGTFIMPEFPSISLSDFRLRDPIIRKNHDLPIVKFAQRVPSDSAFLNRSYVIEDFLEYEAIVSTKIGQTAITSGRLHNDWQKDNRHYFHYKNKEKIRNGFIYHSGNYEVLKDSVDGVDLEIYYHPSHHYNLSSMMSSMKATIEYCTSYFGPFQFDQMRIIEFPYTYGMFAQSFANTISYSEMAGFLMNVDTASSERFSSPFRLTAHEMTHQWWGHQVVPADVLGSKFVTEGMAEYVAAKILERHHGKAKLDLLMKVEREMYFRGRRQAKSESPLVTVHEKQSFVAYHKGCLALYALSAYLGEDTLNHTLGEYAQNVRFKGPPYTTSIEMIDNIKAVTPDSLMYLVEDYLEKVILYDNRVDQVELKKIAENKYLLEVDVIVSKYASSNKEGKVYIDDNKSTLNFDLEAESIHSLPLQDYINVSVFSNTGSGKKIIYSNFHRFDKIYSRITLNLSELPSEIVLDVDHYLLDSDLKDNSKRIISN